MSNHHAESKQEADTMPESEFATFVDDMVASLERPTSEAQKPKHPNEHNTAHDKR